MKNNKNVFKYTKIITAQNSEHTNIYFRFKLIHRMLLAIYLIMI